MDAEYPTPQRPSGDAEWMGRHPRLDASLAAAIRAPIAGERFDERVWALVRAREAEERAMQRMLRMKLGTPWWLASLNVAAIVVTAAIVALALGTSRPIGESGGAALAFLGRPSESVSALALLAGVAALWIGLRQAPFVRSLLREWL